jgi:hypothetical protein
MNYVDIWLVDNFLVRWSVNLPFSCSVSLSVSYLSVVLFTEASAAIVDGNWPGLAFGLLAIICQLVNRTIEVPVKDLILCLLFPKGCCIYMR